MIATDDGPDPATAWFEAIKVLRNVARVINRSARQGTSTFEHREAVLASYIEKVRLAAIRLRDAILENDGGPLPIAGTDLAAYLDATGRLHVLKAEEVASS